jgi:hypothetical protein
MQKLRVRLVWDVARMGKIKIHKTSLSENPKERDILEDLNSEDRIYFVFHKHQIFSCGTSPSQGGPLHTFSRMFLKYTFRFLRKNILYNFNDSEEIVFGILKRCSL